MHIALCKGRRGPAVVVCTRPPRAVVRPSMNSYQPYHFYIYGFGHLAALMEDAWMSWNESPRSQTRLSIIQERGRLSGKALYSVKNLPISKIPVDSQRSIVTAVPTDTLHLTARGGEKHVKGLAFAAAVHEKNKLAPRFQQLIRNAGIPFRISETLVHGKNQIVFSSLTGRRWRQLLTALPALIRQSEDVFDREHKEILAEVIERFNDALKFASYCQKTDAPRLAMKTNNWMKVFLKLGDLGLKGFGRREVTPYCHVLNVHVPYMVSIFGGLSKFSGELVENQNDQVKKTHLKRTHHKDPHKTLLMEKRREAQLMAKELEDLRKAPRVTKQKALHPWY